MYRTHPLATIEKKILGLLIRQDQRQILVEVVFRPL
jgi:hypothetical protein